MQRVIASFAILLLYPALVGLSLFPQHPAAAAAMQAAQSPQGSRRDVCVTNCLRTYEKCQRKAVGAAATKACYQQFEVCQQGCYDGKRQ
jgi:hypothetical protein